MRLCVFEEYVCRGVSGLCEREWGGVCMMCVFYSVDVSVLC